MNNNREITSVCSILCLCNNYPIFNYFVVHGMISFKQTINITNVLHFKPPPPPPPTPPLPLCRAFIFTTWKLWNYSVQIFLVGFPSFLSSTDRWNSTILAYTWCDRTNPSFGVYIIQFCLCFQFELIVNAFLQNIV